MIISSKPPLVFLKKLDWRIALVKSSCFALTLLFCLDASAAGTINVVGSGNDSCGKWVKNRKTATDWHQASQWANGYYVATQELLPKNLSLKEVDTYALMSFLDNYCSDNPLDTIYDAMLPLMKELIQSK